MEKAYGKGVRKRRTKKAYEKRTGYEYETRTRRAEIRKEKDVQRETRVAVEKRGPRDGLVSVVSMVSVVSVVSVRQNVKSTLHLFDEKVVST